MTIFKVILAIFLAIVIRTKGHIAFIKGCANLFSKTFPGFSNVLVSAYNYLKHLYKCTSTTKKIIICISILLPIITFYTGSAIFWVLAVASLSLWLGYKIVHAIQSWFLNAFGPTAVPKFIPPKDFSAAQVHFIINDKWTKETLAISLIQMITNGFLQLTQEKVRTSEGFEITTYTFNRTNVLPKTEDEFLYDNIVGPTSSLTLNNDINHVLNHFNKELASLTVQKTKEVIYYKYPFQRYFFIIAVCCFPFIYILNPLDKVLNSDWAKVFFLIVIIMYGIGTFVSKNKKHPVFKEIAGLNMFLKAICKNENLNIHTSPIQDILPYALSMTIPDAWDKLLGTFKNTDKTIFPFFQPDFKQLISNAVKDVDQ